MVSITGDMQAGSDINVTARNIAQQGQLTAGNNVTMNFTGSYIDNEASKTTAKTIDLLGGSNANLFISGYYDASNATGQGGNITVQADQIRLYGRGSTPRVLPAARSASAAIIRAAAACRTRR